MQGRNLAVRIGYWSARHRRIAIFGWLVLALVGLALVSSVGLNTLSQEDLGTGESRRADQILAEAGLKDRAGEQILVQARTPGLTVRDPEFRAGVDDVISRLRRVPFVTQIRSPFGPGGAGQISRDRRSALITFQLLGDEDDAEERVLAPLAAVEAAQARHPRLRIEEFGDASANRALSEAFERDFRKAETLSIPITLVILVVAFGALVAAALPVLLALSAVAITLGVLAALSQAFPVDEAISSVILLIGLAVGVDYSLFYIRREREERTAGTGPESALLTAAATSGRAVLISGTTVMIAMAGMYVTGNATFQSFATGTILVVAMAMIGSVTVLPALLAWLGDRINKGAVPFVGRLRRDGGAEAGAWSAIVDRVLRHPWLSAAAATAVLLLLAWPARNLHTVNSGAQGLPRSLEIVQTYDRIQAAFPGGPIPAVVAVKAPDVTAPELRRAIAELRRQAVATGLLREPVTITVSPDRTVAQVAIPLVGNGTDERSEEALRVLREEVLPRTVGRLPGVEAPVTGLTAASEDFNDLIKSRAPWVFVFVLSLAFVLMLVTFRSIVIPIKAILLNLLSVAAAYGVLVWVFQYGNLESLLGFRSLGGITSWLPLFLFVILFGLSMDYHVFILTRVREAFDRGHPTSAAVAHGIKSTAGVVTSAATVMVAVFAIFATLSAIDFKEMGVGLSVAVALDATIIRAVLLPATMRLLGDWNWYLPRWLEWLPRIEHAPQPAGLRIDLEHEDGRARVAVAGDLVGGSAGELRRALDDVEGGSEELVVDLRDVHDVDAAGVRELREARDRAHAAGRRLVLVRTPDTRVDEALAASGLDGPG